MNKKSINDNIGIAYDALRECKIAEGNKINKTFRGQISTFGAAVTMGSLLPAIAFFSDDGGSSVKRTKLLNAIYYVIKKSKNENVSANNLNVTDLFKYVRSCKENEDQCKEDVLNAAIALKLAMNMYELIEADAS